MEDAQIIALYWSRDGEAIRQTDEKYGAYCFTIAQRIVQSHEDSEECVNDTWLRAWNAMPPERPDYLKLFLAAITRNLSLDLLKERKTAKRGGGAAAGVFLGLLLLLSGGAELPLFAALALGGMLAGCMRDLGRLASALAMLLAPCIFLFYIDMTLLNPIWIGGLISGALLFSLFPKALLEKYGGLRETEGPQDRYTKMKCASRMGT